MTGELSTPSPERPVFAPGYGVKRSADGLLDWSFVRDRMAAARNYWVVTTRPNGRPHAAPVWGLWLDEAFVFATDPSSRKGQNLAAHPSAVVHLESGDEAVILEGMVLRVSDTAVLERFVDAYDAKYGFRPDPSNPTQGVYRLQLERAFAWTEADFLKTPTRWTVPG
jgi:pyridoxine/pyridoxamine 5'-phosphate oxidase